MSSPSDSRQPSIDAHAAPSQPQSPNDGAGRRDAVGLVTQQFSSCNPGSTVKRLTDYIWNRIFTFNIDDATEAAYELDSIKPQQKVVPINFNDTYVETTKGLLAESSGCG
jgi:hypothetical protein